MFTSLVPMRTFDVFKDFEDLIKSTRSDFNESFPPINIYYVSSSKECVLQACLAGYRKDELSVEVHNNRITVSANVEDNKSDDDKRYFKQRIKKQSFTRTYVVPAGVYDLDATEVTYEDGLLTIVVPAKKPTEPEVKKLEIK